MGYNFEMNEGESDKYNSHYSFSEIAEKYNVSYTTISKALRSKNYNRRYADMIDTQRKKRREAMDHVKKTFLTL